jgi:phosphoribosylformylglycinamidine synthase
MQLNTSSESEAREEATKMCEELLANTVIEDYSIEI